MVCMASLLVNILKRGTEICHSSWRSEEGQSAKEAGIALARWSRRRKSVCYWKVNTFNVFLNLYFSLCMYYVNKNITSFSLCMFFPCLIQGINCNISFWGFLDRKKKKINEKQRETEPLFPRLKIKGLN